MAIVRIYADDSSGLITESLVIFAEIVMRIKIAIHNFGDLYVWPPRTKNAMLTEWFDPGLRSSSSPCFQIVSRRDAPRISFGEILSSCYLAGFLLKIILMVFSNSQIFWAKFWLNFVHRCYRAALWFEMSCFETGIVYWHSKSLA